MMGAMASEITSLTTVYSSVISGADQGKHQRPASLAFVQGIHRSPVNSPHKWPVMRKMLPFDDVIMPLHDSMQWLMRGWHIVSGWRATTQNLVPVSYAANARQIFH